MGPVGELHVDATNADQARAWDGGEGRYWARNAERYDAAVTRYHQRFLDAAAVEGGDRVLDVGCGTGQSTRDAARRARAAGGSALGVDLSSAMLDVARSLAAREGVTNVEFVQADAQIHPFGHGAFDRVISRTGAMFFGDAPAAFANLAAATRPGGRLTLLAWQGVERNEWIRSFLGALAAGRDLAPPPAGAPGPFALSDPAAVRALLVEAGFGVPELVALEEPMLFGTDADDAFGFVLGQLGWMLDGLDDGGRARALEALRATVSAHEAADGVWYGSAAWLITATKS